MILLSAPSAALLERLATRTTNPYDQRPEERAQVQEYVRTASRGRA